MTDPEKLDVEDRVGVALGRVGREPMQAAIKRAQARARANGDKGLKILVRRAAHAQQAIDEGHAVGWERMKKAIEYSEQREARPPRGPRGPAA